MQDEARIIAGSSLKEKVAERLGMDQPSGLDMVDRRSYKDDEAFLDAAVEAELRRSSPEYREVRRRLAGELRERDEIAARKAQAETYSTIRKHTTLDYVDQKEIDAKAAELADMDLAAHRIAPSQLADTIKRYSETLAQKKLDTKASSQLFNQMIREAAGH